MSDEQTGGTADDYRQLHGLMMSSDPTLRAQAQAVAAKFTPAEQQAFFDYQQTANKGKGELTRTDATIGGAPPELAVVGGLGAARTIAGAGAGMVGKAVGAAQAAAPIVKYQATKSVLEHVGVPSPAATVVAGLVSGYRSQPAGASVGGLVNEAQAAAKAPLPNFSASDVMKLKSLISQGVSQIDALKILAATKAGASNIMPNIRP
jgi:hypothetical protein